MSAALDELRAALVSAFRAGLAELDPAGLVERALDAEAAARRGRVVVIAAGKAALGMAQGALRAWGDRIAGGLAVTVAAPATSARDRQAAPADPEEAALRPLRVMRAAHPIPDARSVEAAEAALAAAAALGPDDLLLALVSGGASALLAAPPAGVSLADKQALVAALLEGGAPIQEVNLVRRHLSRIKGGRLAAAAAPARVLTLLLSDVVGGLPHDISSGPTVPDPTRVEEALAALHRRAPQLARLAPALSESLKPSEARLLEARLLADPDRLAERVAAALAGRTGLRAVAAPAEDGHARALVERRLALARALAPGEAVVIPCEPTLALPAQRGAGGRAGWIALAAVRELPPDVALLCAASDGADGSSGAAGAVVARAAAAAMDDRAIDAALAGFDDAAAHRALGTRIETGPTGHNLTDLHIVARAPARGAIAG
ncbi:glycerate kinase [Sorangium sp. So ce134]